ncbi:sensor histidine kinase [Lentzea flaviverrucosa]|uniref:histidine kinase n=1 Tax=Lentzea flaviverrucosa TaxID=200379 RepID=A0A1H9KP86_9PSEU|nr:HAMP domain-containing sensor histidine kinase [Lentzea flaviverrucosa]RDI17942.1 signal transduction histidine kinase [Lentzea flaviverrucosa]SER00869.1 Signal transduction histidine kinase [Lentzea flaviverrucosa]
MSRLRSGTIGVRFTILYAAVFLVSGIGLLGLTFLLSGGRTTDVAPPPGLDSAQQHVRQLQDQLAEVHAQQARQLLAGSLLALVVMAVVSLLVGRVLARRVLRPLRTITSATRRISADSLDRRLAVAGPADEVKGLADTIDELLERLEVSFAAQRRFAANASHELRTPLTTMRASLDVAVAKPDPAASTVALADRLRVQLDRVDHLLDGFLVLARAQHGVLADSAPVDLGELVEAALHDLAGEVLAKGLTVVVDVPPGTGTQGSPALLARLVGNVVDNAVKHNEDGGWVRVSGSVSEKAELVVETGGAVFEQREVDRLTQPFERLGGERIGSSGLGLSIVAAIAAAHGGHVALLARPEGGLHVSITLPAAAVPA